MDVNPYESPTPWESEPGSRESIVGRLVRVAVLALVGFGVFVAFAGLYYILALAIEPEPQAARWPVGVVCAVIFASSEIFNSGRGRKAGVVPRIVVASGIGLSSVIVTALIFASLGWGATTYHEQEHGGREPAYAGFLPVLVFMIGLWFARYVWSVRETSV